MAVWSALLRSTGQALKRGTNVILKNPVKNGTMQVRFSHDRIMPMTPSRWQWEKTKDYLHLYIMVGAIPCLTVVILTHVFVGPAELRETPEGYEPKYWEYYRDPISRFLARYVSTSPQMEYEKYLHFIDEEYQKKRIRELHRDVMTSMEKHKDTPAFYYVPFVSGRYVRQANRSEDDHYEYGRGS